MSSNTGSSAARNLTATAPTRCDGSSRAGHLQFRLRTSKAWKSGLTPASQGATVSGSTRCGMAPISTALPEPSPVAQHRGGDFVRAAQEFHRAFAQLRARSAGPCVYAQPLWQPALADAVFPPPALVPWPDAWLQGGPEFLCIPPLLLSRLRDADGDGNHPRRWHQFSASCSFHLRA